MKKNKITILSAVAIGSLLIIGIVMATGVLNKKPGSQAKTNVAPEILGEFAQASTTPTTPTPINVNQLVQDSWQNTKEVVLHTATEKVTEIEKTVVNTVNNEISNLSQSQIDALKIQICRDLGVITVVPTKQP
jgi:Rieske Fe-S protein